MKSCKWENFFPAPRAHVFFRIEYVLHKARVVFKLFIWKKVEIILNVFNKLPSIDFCGIIIAHLAVALYFAFLFYNFPLFNVKLW